MTLPTRWSDNDIYGHMNNVVHYALIDSAVNGWLIGNGLIDIQGGDTIGLVVETGCRYFAESRGHQAAALLKVWRAPACCSA